MTFDTAFTTALRNLRMILSDDEQERMRKVARDVYVAALEEAKETMHCAWAIAPIEDDPLETMLDAISDLIQQVQGDSNGNT